MWWTSTRPEPPKGRDGLPTVVMYTTLSDSPSSSSKSLASSSKKAATGQEPRPSETAASETWAAMWPASR